MNQGIVDYLNENKDKFPKDTLIEQLVKVGHLPEEIQEAAEFVYGEKTEFMISNNSVYPAEPTSFWDFKGFKTYTTFAEKRNDFLLGFFAAIVSGFVFRIIPFAGGIISFGLYIFALVFFYKRRKFIFYGLLADILLGILIVIILAVIVSLSLSRFH